MTYAKQNLDQRFVALTFLDGTSIPPPPETSDYSSAVFLGVGALTTRSITAAAYYRVLSIADKITHLRWWQRGPFSRACQ